MLQKLTTETTGIASFEFYFIIIANKKCIRGRDNLYAHWGILGYQGGQPGILFALRQHKTPEEKGDFDTDRYSSGSLGAILSRQTCEKGLLQALGRECYLK